MSRRSVDIFLIPGFFGFANLGEFRYFEHVRSSLTEALGRLGLVASLHDVRSRPTASLRDRALRVARAIEDIRPTGDVHLIGHSVGGLDARLLVSPGVALGGDAEVEGIASRVRSIVTVATPHRGTPLATAFQSATGRELLRLISLVTFYSVREQRLPRSVVRQLVELVTRLDKGRRDNRALLDEAYRELLEGLPAGQREDVEAFFDGVTLEQDLLPQLSPAALELLRATIRDRAGVRTGCVVTRARPPRLLGMADLGFDPYAQSMYVLYRWLHGQAALPEGTRLPMPRDVAAALEEGLGDVPSARASDGIVPTLSQHWGEVVCATRADHLDVIGHFDDDRSTPPHFDWLPSGSGFGREEFRRVWARVAQFLVGAVSGP